MTALAEATEGNFPSRDRRPHPDRTVSREHAHIAFHKRSGEYRLYNDRWYKQGHKGDGGCGLWIIRDGLSQEVHRNARGTRLQHGDEIHLGRAVVKFQLK